MATKHYYKKKLVNKNIQVEYSSEADEVTIIYNPKLVMNTRMMGTSIGTPPMRIHPSCIKPLIELLKEVIIPPAETRTAIKKRGSDE